MKTLLELHRRALEWLASDDTGCSSEAILYACLGMPKGKDFPHDGGDLGRCLRMLRKFPEFQENFREFMPRVSSIWAYFITHWDEMAELLEEEIGPDLSRDRTAPRTYALMQQVEGQAYVHAADWDCKLREDGTLSSASKKIGKGSVVNLGNGVSVSL